MPSERKRSSPAGWTSMPPDGDGSRPSLRKLTRHSIRMTADRLLVVPPNEFEERKTRGGILIPPTAASEAGRAIWAEVVAVGPMVRVAEAGDLVLFSPDVGFEVEIRSEDYLVVRERDVHAVASERGEGNTGLYL